MLVLRLVKPALFLVYTREDTYLTPLVSIEGVEHWGFDSEASIETVSIYKKSYVLTLPFIPPAREDIYAKRIYDATRDSTCSIIN